MTRATPTGHRIRERRLALGLKQREIAATAGISPSYLNLIEHNRRAIGGALLSRLAAALRTDRAALAEEGDAELVDALQTLAGLRGTEARALDQAGDLARRHPGWARLLLSEAEANAAQSRRIDALTDRLTHDPTLAEAVHELMSSVAAVRSMASILAQTPEIDPNWLARFHVNLDEDSRRLAERADMVRGLFDARPALAETDLLPAETVARFLDAHGHRFDRLEDAGADAIPDLVAGIADPVAREMAAEVLAGDAADAARLPQSVVMAAKTPADLFEAAKGDVALVLRRMGTRDPTRGLLVCDAAGAVLRRKPVAGFPPSPVGAGCPLWPVYAALSAPGHLIDRTVEMPDGAAWQAQAIATLAPPVRFGQPSIVRATMLLTPVADASASGRAIPVGPGCRVCPRVDCPARREPGVLTARLDKVDDAMNTPPETRPEGGQA
ncbi:short-chain fatty acyl-CoA regulator family protein [uncultured Jannaschia sp.]|uniref:short-chain fatty acyl-CoA regulator family protein n=1 Tax=uncultured Jannaschia sp. TaxID=293347 RepID=UPI00263282A2|nr:short-chain fatty acyl-CoA regulator family protein [uncultured Jannaschia sp.]